MNAQQVEIEALREKLLATREELEELQRLYYEKGSVQVQPPKFKLRAPDETI